VRNVASRRVLEKLGFTEVGTDGQHVSYRFVRPAGAPP
jgi:RimJ/RimL family protein N-acetyltransferase